MLIHPAIIIPSKRTGEIQRLLDGLIFSEPKRKCVYPPEEGLDYTSEDVNSSQYEAGETDVSVNCKYNPSRERKLVLTRLGTSLSAVTKGSAGEGSMEEGEGVDPFLREAMNDAVWQDARVQSLLEPSEVSADIASDGVAPFGKPSIRPSYIRLPASPYDLLTVDEVLRRIMPTKCEDGEAGVDTNDSDTSNYCIRKNNNNNLCANNGNPLIEEIPSSFETAGHIAHVNLREEALPYKYLIGKAILDKNTPRIRLVVNKIGNIENEFRTFPMEILAIASGKVGSDDDGCFGFAETAERLCAGTTSGVSNSSQTSSQAVQVKIGPQHQSLMQVEVREHGCRFHLDFARVYFNSRLQGEHARLVQFIFQDSVQHQQQRMKARKEHEKMAITNNTSGGEHAAEYTIVADAMAGVGPFAIPLTSSFSINASPYRKAKIICYANDLNPISYEYLQKNAKINKCPPERLFMYNMDARQFIQKMNEDRVDVDHVIMNLPQLAPEFLDAFRGWRFHDDSRKANERQRPMIHVHCFGEKARTPDDNLRVERQVQQRCEIALGCDGCFNPTNCDDSSSGAKRANEFAVRIVRDVGPKKNMLCVSFRLPLEVASVQKMVFPIEIISKCLVNAVDECADNGKRRQSSEDTTARLAEGKRNKK